MSRRAVTGEVRRQPLNMKTTDSLRRRLEEEAERSGRTLSHEVEYRLERSVERDDTYNGAASVEIMDQLGQFLKIFSAAYAFENRFATNTLARAAIKAAFEKIVDEELPVTGGIMQEQIPVEPQLVESFEIASRRIVDAIQANAMLRKYVGMRSKAGALAPHLGESPVEWAERTDFWKKTAEGQPFPASEPEAAAPTRGKRKKNAAPE